ncbi:guanine nucleotide exchange factor eIF-2B delta chain [Cryptosporidium ryanae]|uniref:guanine nucleotide exchange factor eIF-2B delta chain n=1 Tax=Cryptosporidium ryanae TaxID=515981 RepID=UPI00351A8880|nr:guanine nucleotide exchange factor eIF-2B delta chain [Cryptosporidium ryanae]
MERKQFVHNIFNCAAISDETKVSTLESLTSTLDQSKIHPAVLRLGVRMRDRRIMGTNMRSKCLLVAIGQMLEDYFCPPYKSIEKHLKMVLDTQISYITIQRQHNIAMGNVIKWLKKEIANINPSHSSSEIINQLIFSVKTYIHQRIINACERISYLVSNNYILEDDIIVTYSNSSSVFKSLLKAANMGKNFQLIIVNSKNNFEESNEMTVRELSLKGIKITYILLNSVAHHLKHATKVIIGSCAIFSNGYVMNRSGSALISMLANISNVPVVVLTESYKLSEKSYFEGSTTFNEVIGWEIDNERETCVNLYNVKGDTNDSTVLYFPCYDVIPPKFINVIVTEDGIFSPSTILIQS